MKKSEDKRFIVGILLLINHALDSKGEGHWSLYARASNSAILPSYWEPYSTVIAHVDGIYLVLGRNTIYRLEEINFVEV